MKQKIQIIIDKIQALANEKDIPTRDTALTAAFAELGQLLTADVNRTVSQGAKTTRQFIHSGDEVDLVVTVITEGASFTVSAALDDA
jgi:hypothetical protein